MTYYDRFIKIWTALVLWGATSILARKNLTTEQLQWHSQLWPTITGDMIDNTSLSNLSTHSCLNKSRNTLCCDCGRDCIKFGTCCFDAFFEIKPMPPHDYIATLLQLTKPYQSVKCLPIFPNIPAHNELEHVFQITACDKNIINQSGIVYQNDSRLEKKCTDALNDETDTRLLKPVLSTAILGGNQFVYKNKYCALCNGVDRFEPIDVSIRECKLRDLSDSVKTNQFVDCIYFTKSLIESSDLRCNDILDRGDTLIDNPRTRFCTESEFNLCRSYQAWVEYDGVTYQNEHCLKCMKGIRLFQRAECMPKFLNFNVTDKGYSTTIEFVGHKVEKPKCLDGFKLERSKCVPDFQELIIGPLPTLKIQNFRNLNVTNNLVKASRIGNALKHHTEIRCIVTLGGSVTIFARDFESSMKILNSFKAHGIYFMAIEEVYVQDIEYSIIRNVLPLNVSDIYRMINTLQQNETVNELFETILISPLQRLKPSFMYGFQMQHMFPNGKVCASPNTTEVKFRPNGICNFHIMGENMTSINSSIFWLEISKETVDVYGVYCLNFHLSSPCFIETHLNGNFEELQNKSVILKSHSSESSLLPPDKYTPTLEGIQVCKHSSTRNSYPKWYAYVKLADRILASFGGILSIIAVTITIITYAIFDKLHNNTPGKNVMSLSTTVILSDILIICHMYFPKSYISCKTIGILLHWSMLSQHLWCSAITFDLWYTFRDSLQVHMISFKVYSTVTWALSTIIVAICVLLDEMKGYIKYGYDDICWIGSLNGKIVAYIAPLAVTLVMNVVLFILCMYKINQQRKLSVSTLGHQSTSSRMRSGKLAMKIALLLGFIEVIGLIQIPGNNDESLIVTRTFLLLYTCVRSLRGFFIFLSFIAKKKILRMYKNRFQMMKDKGSSTSGASTIGNTGICNNNRDSVNYTLRSHDTQL